MLVAIAELMHMRHGTVSIVALCILFGSGIAQGAPQVNPAGVAPIGTPVSIGASIYGLTSGGGVPCNDTAPARPMAGIPLAGCGVLYRYDGSGYRVLHRFDEARPDPELAAAGDVLYGSLTFDDQGIAARFLFHIRDDGSAYTLYRDHTVRSITPLASGGVAVVVHDGNDASGSTDPQSLLIFAPDGSERTVALRDSKTRITGPVVLAARGYVAAADTTLTQGPCRGSASIGDDGEIGPIDCNATLPSKITRDAQGDLLGTDPTSVSRFAGATAMKAATLPRAIDPRNHLPLLQILSGAAALSADGDYVVSAYSPIPIDPGQRCGRVLRLPRNKASATERVFGADDPGCTSVFNLATSAGLTTTSDREVYGVLPAALSCGATNADPGSPAYLACGAIYRIDSEFQYVHRFDAPAAPTPTSTLDARLDVSGGPARFRLLLQRTPASGAAFSVDTSHIVVSLTGEQHRVSYIATPVDTRRVTSHFVAGNTAVVELTLATHETLLPDRYDAYAQITSNLLSDANATALALNGDYPKIIDPLYIHPGTAASEGIPNAGDRFLGLGGTDAPRDDRGRFVTGSIYRLIAIDAPDRNGTWRFHLHADRDRATIVVRMHRDASGAPLARILPDDANSVRAARTWEGRPWHAITGTPNPACGATVDAVNADRAVGSSLGGRIVGVYRIATVASMSANAQRMSDSGVDYQVAQPLAVIVAGGKRCPRAVALFADPWDIERSVSLRDPFASRPEWTPAVRRAIDAGNVIPGMTREMVVASLGYPSAFATVAEMNTLDHWFY